MLLYAPHSCTLVLAHGTKQMMVMMTMMMMICSMVLMIADLDDATGNRGEEPKIRKYLQSNATINYCKIRFGFGLFFFTVSLSLIR